MDLKTLSLSIAQFSGKFCNELDKETSVVSSPLSAEFVLALLTLGTTDPAHAELLTSLNIPDDDSIRSGFSLVSSKLKAITGVTLNVANKVYIKQGAYELVPRMKNDAVEVFDAEIEKLDFSNSDVAAEIINKWVESKTNKKIRNLLSPGSIDSTTRLVLVNALYFKGTWKKQFNPARTLSKRFYINEQTTVNLPMMYQENKFKFGWSQHLRAQLLEIPYEGESASMIIVLPDEISGLDEVLQKLADGYDLMTNFERFHIRKVQVTIPKFKIETEIDLMEILPKLGIRSIFMSNSGLTKILCGAEDLRVSKAVQKAFIEVNEEGAEAAAASAFGVSFCTSVQFVEQVPEFIADHPFLAIIVVDGNLHFMVTQRGVDK